MMSGYVKTPKELGIRTDCQGIYIETTKSKIEASLSTGYLEFGIGDTREGTKQSTIASRMRGHESSKNPGHHHYLLDSIPNPGYRDYALHREVAKNFATQITDPFTGKRNEVFSVKVNQNFLNEFRKTKNFEPIRQWISAGIRKCAAKLNATHAKQSVTLRKIQEYAESQIMEELFSNNELDTNFVCEFAPRTGKTLLFLHIGKVLHEKFGHEAMFVAAYGVGLGVKTSYKNELSKYSDFDKMQFIDAAEETAEHQYRQAKNDGEMPVVFISLNPAVEEKYEWIHKLQGTYTAVLEETDFGTHTDSQVKKVEYILKNKTVTRFNTSGTNIGRLARAFGKNAIDKIISIPYCMVESDTSIPNVVRRRFFNALLDDRINKLLEDFDKNLLPNITKILSKPLSNEKFITALFQDIFGYQSIYGFNISECAGEEIRHCMLFVNINKSAMKQLITLLEKVCPEHKVLILNGDYTDNKTAEDLTKESLLSLQQGHYTGRDKLLVITNMMGTRSYSIPEIQACLFMQEGGDVYPYMQKYSRCLTPDEHGNKKFGYIFDFAFDQSKTRNSVMAIGVDASALTRNGLSPSFPGGIREVLNTVNIKNMVDGKWMNTDDIIKQFEDNDKLLEIANASTRITIEDLTDKEIEIFGELAKRSSNRKEKLDIEKIVKTGKTFQSKITSLGKSKKNPLRVMVEKAIRMINGSATTVLALSNYQGETFLECVNIVNNNAEMREEFIQLYGVTPDAIIRLQNLLQLSTLDIIVRMSKYNNKQKHIENNSLAILKDDPKLWYDAFKCRKLRSFIKSEQCKNILVEAGGHGTEIDVLVDIFGVDIINKIVYNDKYSFLCNQIKHKYPNIRVMKGDFLEVEFNMKFDVTVGNPPYQNSNENNQGSSGKLWMKFVEKSISLLENEGYMVLVHPIGWRQLNNKMWKNIYQTYQIESVVIEPKVNWNVGVEVDYYVLKNTPYTLPTKVTYNDGTVQMVDFRNVNGLLSNANITNVLDKIQSPDTLKFNHKHSHDTRREYMSPTKKKGFMYPIQHTGAQEPWWSSKKHEWQDMKKVIVSRSGYLEPFYDAGESGTSQESYSVFVSSMKEGMYIIRLLNSKLYRFIIQVQKTNGFNDIKMLNTLPYPKDLSENFRDEELYEYFGLTQNEIDLIEETIQ